MLPVGHHHSERVQRGMSLLLTAALLTMAVAATAQPTLQPLPIEPAPPLVVLPTQPTPPPARGPEDALGRGTPRGTARGFFDAARAGDYEKAAEFLDLRRLPAARRVEDGPALAKQLKAILDRTIWMDLDDLSDEPEGNTEDGLPGKTDRLGSLDTRTGVVDVKLARVPRDDGALIWRVSADTVRHVPALNEEFGLPAYAAQLPPVLLETRVFDVALWQWLAFGLLLLAAAATGWLVEILVRRSVLFVAGNARRAAARVLDAIGGPLRFVFALLVFQGGLPFVGLPVRAQQFLVASLGTLWVVAGTWVALRIAEAVSQRIVRQLTGRGQLSATALVPAGRRMARFMIYAIGLLFALRSFGVNVTALVAGLGVGGLAVALAAQKTLENLFGGITIIADAPVRVGDPCRFGTKEGIVEEIGLRSTRIRTPERTVIAVPNAEFAALQLENLARRDRFLLTTHIGVRAETTSDQLRLLLAGIQGRLHEHPLVDKETAHARLVGFAPGTLEIEVHAYVRTAEVEQFQGAREELLLQVMDVLRGADTGLAPAPPLAVAAKR